MKVSRFIVLVSSLAAAFGAESLVGRTIQENAPPVVAGSPFDTLHFRSIGPAAMSGRISDIAVYEPNPAIFFVGTAHGGVWKTTNNGTTFEAQFQQQGLMSIGDVAVSQNNPDLVWVGTGESNNRQSTSWGDGIYKSTDGGKTYVNMGLRTSRYIGRIVIDARNNDVVYVAAAGSLWGPGGERGIFKTIDGGRSWKQTLKVDEETGANDLVIDPDDGRILYATTYQRRRTACCMNGGGPGSGIWKSTDAGETWTRLTKGLPNEPMGRIGIDVYRRRSSILYALIEGQAPASGRANAPEGEQPAGGRGTTVTGVNDQPTGLYRSDDAGATWRKVNNENPRPMYFSQIRIDPNDPDVVIYGGVDLHMSTDGGKTVNTAAAPKIHSDHHAIWFDPANSNHVMIGNDGGLAVSYDHARTWNFLPNLPVGLFYHVSYDMATPYHVCGGMQDNYVWCGPSQVRGGAGIANYQWITMQGGDGFMALQDPNEFRFAYSESQDGNMVRIDRVTNETMSMRPLPASGEALLRWQWDTPLTMSPHDPKVIYAPAQRVFRSADRGLTWTAISPDLTTGANREDIVTMGVKGSEIRISKDDGIQAWPAIVSFAESPKRAGVLYAGTDDGNLQTTRDGGRTWTNVAPNIQGVPKGAWVSRIAPSRFDEGTVYVTFDAHRQNDFATYVFASRDFGQTWQSAAGNLTGVVLKTVTEDVRNPDVLYLGAETGLYVSIDRGKRWTHVTANLPTVRIDEITIQPRDNAMILATHGRAIWILDHLEPIQEYAAAQAAADARLFAMPPSTTYRRPANDRNYEFWGDQTFFGENPPQAAVISWLNKTPVREVKLEISDAAGRQIREIAGPVLAGSGKPGIQTACWDLRVQPVPAAPSGRANGPGATGTSDPEREREQSPFGAGCAAGGGRGGGFNAGPASIGPLVPGGSYTVTLTLDGKNVDSKPLRVGEDPEVVLTAVERRKLYDMALELHRLQAPLTEASAAHASLTRQVNELSAKADAAGGEAKTALDAYKKELGVLAPSLAPPAAGRGGFGRGSASESLLAKLGAAKNGLMGGMWPGEQTMKGYADVKARVPKAVSDLNALISRADVLRGTLAKANLSLTVPQPVRISEPAQPRKGSQMR